MARLNERWLVKWEDGLDAVPLWVDTVVDSLAVEGEPHNGLFPDERVELTKTVRIRANRAVGLDSVFFDPSGRPWVVSSLREVGHRYLDVALALVQIVTDDVAGGATAAVVSTATSGQKWSVVYGTHSRRLNVRLRSAPVPVRSFRFYHCIDPLTVVNREPGGLSPTPPFTDADFFGWDLNGDAGQPGSGQFTGGKLPGATYFGFVKEPDPLVREKVSSRAKAEFPFGAVGPYGGWTTERIGVDLESAAFPPLYIRFSAPGEPFHNTHWVMAGFPAARYGAGQISPDTGLFNEGDPIEGGHVIDWFNPEMSPWQFSTATYVLDSNRMPTGDLVEPAVIAPVGHKVAFPAPIYPDIIFATPHPVTDQTAQDSGQLDRFNRIKAAVPRLYNGTLVNGQLYAGRLGDGRVSAATLVTRAEARAIAKANHVQGMIPAGFSWRFPPRGMSLNVSERQAEYDRQRQPNGEDFWHEPSGYRVEVLTDDEVKALLARSGNG